MAVIISFDVARGWGGYSTAGGVDKCGRVIYKVFARGKISGEYIYVFAVCGEGQRSAIRTRRVIGLAIILMGGEAYV